MNKEEIGKKDWEIMNEKKCKKCNNSGLFHDEIYHEKEEDCGCNSYEPRICKEHLEKYSKIWDSDAYNSSFRDGYKQGFSDGFQSRA